MSSVEAAGDTPATPRPLVQAEPGATQSMTVMQPTPVSNVIASIEGWAGAMVAAAGVVALIYKLLTRDVKRDVDDVKRDVASLRSTVKNESARTDSLEHFRTADIERIVRLEASAENVKESLSRIETGQQKAFAELASSIREIRVVSPRG